MKETRAGVFSRGKSPYVEIEAKRSDTCREFACNAASVGLKLVEGWSSPYLN